jgi:hypothetical protein
LDQKSVFRGTSRPDQLTWQHIGGNFIPGLNIADLDLDQDLEDFMQVLANDSCNEIDDDDIEGKTHKIQKLAVI